MARTGAQDRRFLETAVRLGYVSKDDARTCLEERSNVAETQVLPPIREWVVAAGLLSSDQARAIPDEGPSSGKRKSIGGYRIVGRIGKGGMGELYKAHDPHLDKHFAVKLIHRERAREAKYLQRFLEEAKLASRVDDPHTVPILKFGEERGRYYCIMPFVEGQDVGRHVASREGFLSRAEALSILEQAARGLAAIHRIGIVHRDVKPANLLIDPTGRVRVTDFGLARDTTTDSHLTRTGEVMGTPQYMSPEQVMGMDVDLRSDVYSLGLTFYFLLTGQPPFDDENAYRIVDRQRHDPLPDPAAINRAAGGEPIKLLRRMTAKDPDERPASMEEVLADIETIRARGRIRGPRRRLRPRGPVVAAIAVAIALCLGTVGLLVGGGDRVEPIAIAPDPESTDADLGPDEMFAAAEAFEESAGGDPARLPEVLARYRAVAEAHPDSLAARVAGERAAACLQPLLDELWMGARARIEGGRLAEALDLVAAAADRVDDGAWRERRAALEGEVVSAARQALARSLEERQASIERARPGRLIEAIEFADEVLAADLPARLGPGVEAGPFEELRALAQERLTRERNGSSRLLTQIDRQLENGHVQVVARARGQLSGLLEPGVLESLGGGISATDVRSRLERADAILAPARAEKMAQVIGLVASGQSIAARTELATSAAWIADGGESDQILAAFDTFHSSLDRFRLAFWFRLLAGRLGEIALVVEYYRERLELLETPYPLQVELAPLDLYRAAAGRIVARLGQAAADSASVELRRTDEERPSRRVIVRVEPADPPTDARIVYRNFRESKEHTATLLDFAAEDLVALAVGDAGDPDSIGLAAGWLAGRGRSEALEALARRAADPGLRLRLTLWARWIEAVRKIETGAAPVEADTLRRLLPSVLGPRVRLLSVEADRIEVEAEFEFDRAEDLAVLERNCPLYELAIDTAAGQLQVDSRIGKSAATARFLHGLLLLPGTWEGPLEIEMTAPFAGFLNQDLFLLLGYDGQRGTTIGLDGLGLAGDAFPIRLSAGLLAIEPRSLTSIGEMSVSRRTVAIAPGDRYTLAAEADGATRSYTLRAGKEKVHEHQGRQPVLEPGRLGILWSLGDGSFRIDRLRVRGWVQLASLPALRGK